VTSAVANNVSRVLVLKVTGGLGNQLFKIISGAKTATDQNRFLILDLTFYSYNFGDNSKTTKRDFEANYFPELSKFQVVKNKYSFFERNWQRFLRRQSPFLRRSFGLYVEGDGLSSKRRKLFLEGNFESIECLPDSAVVRSLLRFPDSTSKWFEQESKWMSQHNPISIHVRRGDYLRHPEIYDVVDKNYYIDSISKIPDFSERPIYLFSDDIQDAIDWLHPLKPFRISNPPPGVKSGEVLRLLSLSQDLVIAPSTFSWWAAYLGTINGTCKNVFIPKKFTFLPGDDVENNLLLDNWTLQES
jgi:hypothetical protein